MSQTPGSRDMLDSVLTLGAGEMYAGRLPDEKKMYPLSWAEAQNIQARFGLYDMRGNVWEWYEDV